MNSPRSWKTFLSDAEQAFMLARRQDGPSFTQSPAWQLTLGHKAWELDKSKEARRHFEAAIAASDPSWPSETTHS